MQRPKCRFFTRGNRVGASDNCIALPSFALVMADILVPLAIRVIYHIGQGVEKKLLPLQLFDDG